MDKIFAICLVVLVASTPIQGFFNFANPFAGMGGGGAGAGGQGSAMSAYMGFQMCNPSYRGSHGQGGMPGGAGGPGRPGMGGPMSGPPGGPGGPGGPGMSQRPNPASFMMGMAMDVPDAPDFGFGCFCQNFGNECFGLGLFGTDPRCSRYGLCCSCDGWI